MKVLLIEDEAPAYRRLAKLIQEGDRSIEIVGIIQSVKSGIEWFQSNPSPDLIFSDIQLADDLSFTIFKELSITIPIIFITAYDEYAIKAFKYYSIDYLLKPINADDLKNSLEKYKTIQHKSNNNNFDELINKLSQKKYRERFLVYSGDTLIPVHCSDVAYFISEDGVTIMVTKEDKHHFIVESLDKLEDELNPLDFFRVNRQFIISSKAIEKIHNYGNQKLKLIIKPAATEDIIISKLKATAFKNWLGR
jgi:DNA-binding LytR/AlgR family response regulator